MRFPKNPVINDELKVFEDEGKAVMHRLLQPNVRYFFGPQMFSRIKSILKLEKKLCMAKSNGRRLTEKRLGFGQWRFHSQHEQCQTRRISHYSANERI